MAQWPPLILRCSQRREAEPHRIKHSHKYDRNTGSCRFQGYGCLRVAGNEQIGTERDQLGGQSWQALRGLGKTILDNEVLAGSG